MQRSSSYLCLPLAGLIATLGFCENASARGAKVAALVPVFQPTKAAELAERFHEAVVEGLRGGGVSALPATATRRVAATPCELASCARGTMAKLKVANAVSTRIESVGKNYRFVLKAFPGGNPVVTGRCDVCTLMEALSSVRKLSQRLAMRLRASERAKTAAGPARPRATRRAATVAHAQPKIARPKARGGSANDKPARATPMAPTQHRRNHSDAATPTTAAGGRSAGLAGAGDAPSGTGAANKNSGGGSVGETWPLWPAVVAAGIGIVGLATGIPVLSLDGEPTNCRGTPRPDGRNCEDIYATSGPGWALTAAGIGGLAAASVFFYLYFNSNGHTERRSASSWVIPKLGLGIDGKWTLGAIGHF